LPFSSNSKNAFSPRVSTSTWPLLSNVTLAGAPVPSGNATGTATMSSIGAC
jgi:hypothetical protein